MAQRKFTINLPRSPEVLKDLVTFLLQRGLISEKEANTIENGDTTKASKKKSRWELAAERLDSEGFLDGQGEKVKSLIRNFREGFNF
jgi:hypothetical protein